MDWNAHRNKLNKSTLSPSYENLSRTPEWKKGDATIDGRQRESRRAPAPRHKNKTKLPEDI